MQQIIVSVTNDLITDQRAHKICCTLQSMGYEVLLVGRMRNNSTVQAKRNYKTVRMVLAFKKGPFFYAAYNIRLFFKLIFSRATIYYANDLDTLPANYFAAIIRRKRIIFDSHEYFTGVPELQERPFVRLIWKRIEKLMLPRIKNIITVSQGIANLYEQEYGVKAKVIRNIPLLNTMNTLKNKQELGIDAHKKIILYQGALNQDRGLEEVIEAMMYIENAVFLIIGSGDLDDKLRLLASSLGVTEKVIFLGRLPFEELPLYTGLADIGVSLEKTTNANYANSLPNKVFDYIHAGVPVFAANLKEVKRILEQYVVGTCIDNHSPLFIAQELNNILNDEQKLQTWRQNTIKARNELNWQKEEKQLLALLHKIR